MRGRCAAYLVVHENFTLLFAFRLINTNRYDRIELRYTKLFGCVDLSLLLYRAHLGLCFLLNGWCGLASFRDLVL